MSDSVRLLTNDPKVRTFPHPPTCPERSLPDPNPPITCKAFQEETVDGITYTVAVCEERHDGNSCFHMWVLDLDRWIIITDNRHDIVQREEFLDKILIGKMKFHLNNFLKKLDA